MADHNHVIVYADGGSRGNPGTAGSGTVVYAADGRTVLREIVYVVGRRATNNVAEYHGMLRGLEAARDLGARTVDVHIRRLRAKLGPDHESLIGTVRNVGYKAVRPSDRREDGGDA